MNKLSSMPVIIGLAGTLNAGKDSLGDVLAAEYGFLHMSTSDMIRLMKKREFGDTPQALLLRNDPFINKLRSERGPGFLVQAVNDDWENEKDKYPGGYVASAIRAIGEAEKIHELNGIIIFVDADPKVRYQRSQARGRDANEQGRSFEEFMATERSEIDVDPTDKSVQNLTAMREMADIIITNEYGTIEEFQVNGVKQIKDYLGLK
ncbi:MAG: dephospho-CoA kinase [Candidatus Saccharimonadales bacterium]|jgi:dephospho-CoA kinase